MGNSWALILAAGSSRRMGSQKLLLPFGQSTIIETVIDNVLNSSIDHVMVVLGANQKKIQDTIGNLPVQFCHNMEHERGMLSSVICGIRALPQDAITALIFLGDQPGIPPAVTNTVIDAYNEELVGIVIPVHNHRRGHPLLVDMKYRKEIEHLDLEEGLRALRHHFPDDVLEVDVDEPGILVDIDTREDYKNATN
jgi:molybdenum cofactor cytidylyltransferase